MPKLSFLRRQRLGVSFGPLSVLAILLLVSSILRFFGGPAAAIAKEMNEIRSVDTDFGERMQCEPPPDIAAVLDALVDRETRVGEREEYFAKRSVALAKAEAEIDAKLSELMQAETELEATLAMAATAAEDDVSRLVAVYENMKPKDAARLFETMSPTFAAGFLGRMRPDAAAKIVGGLAPDIAYSISVVLAGRNADVPKQ